MIDAGQIKNLEAAGCKNPERRSALLDRIFDAEEAVADAISSSTKALCFRLEGRESSPVDRGAVEAFNRAVASFEEVRVEASRFLMVEGHEPEHRPEITDAARDAMNEVEEEDLADAVSGLREGTLTRRGFEERRARVVQARAKFDAAVDELLTKVAVSVDA